MENQREEAGIAGGFPYQNDKGRFIMLADLGSGKVQEMTPEVLARRKNTFLRSLDSAVESGSIGSSERKRVLLAFIVKNPKMLEVFEIE